MNRLPIILFLSCTLCGCGFLLVDVPIRVPIKGQEKFVNKKYMTKQDMYIVKYQGETGHYMYTQFDPATADTVTLIPKGTTLIGMHITRLNGWPNGTFYHCVARLENWEIFQPKFVVDAKMGSAGFYQLDPDLFELIK